jgi:predicted TIM-barrel fold metal-dependent hydrolase
MNEFPFVDAHVHLWDLSHIQYPWLTPPFTSDGPNGSVESIAKTYLLDDYLADAVRWRVDSRGLPSGIVAYTALDSPNVETQLEQHAMYSRVRGIRQIVNWHTDPKRTYTSRDVTRDAAWAHGFQLLSGYNLSFDLQCYPRQMMGLSHQIQVILNHAGMPVDLDEDGKARWRVGMRALAALPNVTTKLSGFGFVHRAWTIDQIRPYLLEAIDIFGTRRCMFASDFPTDKLFGTFDRHLNAYHAIVADFSTDERLDLFARNAARIYRLNIAVEAPCSL